MNETPIDNDSSSFNNNTNTNDDVMNLNVACCFCVRDCSAFLPIIFKNLNRLSKHFSGFYVLFIHDNCSDNSPELLEQFKQSSDFTVYVIHNDYNGWFYRTMRIASSRNKGLHYIYDILPNIDFHFMIDADNVNVPSWNIPLIKRSLRRNDWDALSFNRPHYYDAWALAYEPFKHHFCDWGEKNGPTIGYIIQKDISERLDSLGNDELFVCDSAFNGFSIYRTPVFKYIIYDGIYENCKHLLSEQDRSNTLHYLRGYIDNIEIADRYEICEHVFFHMSAARYNGARIRISKEFIMDTPIICD
jgi:hypothetical protein